MDKNIIYYNVSRQKIQDASYISQYRARKKDNIFSPSYAYTHNIDTSEISYYIHKGINDKEYYVKNSDSYYSYVSQFTDNIKFEEDCIDSEINNDVEKLPYSLLNNLEDEYKNNKNKIIIEFPYDENIRYSDSQQKEVESYIGGISMEKFK